MKAIFDFTNDVTQKTFLIDQALVLLKQDSPVLWVDGSVVNLTLSAQPVTENLFNFYFNKHYTKLWNDILISNRNFFYHKISNNKLHQNTIHEIVDIPEIDEIISQQIVTFLKDSSPCIIHTTSLRKKFITLANVLNSEVQTILSSYPITDVYVFNGRFLPEAITAKRANAANLALLYIETFSIDWKDRYWIFQRPVHSANYRSKVMVEFSSKIDSNELLKVSSAWLMDRKYGKSQKFTSHMTRLYNNESNNNKKLIVFFHSSEDELITTNLAKSPWVNQFTAIASLKEILNRNTDWKLIVRVHPNLSTKSKRERRKWNTFESEMSSPSVEFIPFDSPINSYDLISLASIVVTFGSTIGVEAVLAGKLSLLMSNAFHEPMNICRVVHNQEEIEMIMKSFLNRSEVPSAENIRAARIYAFFMAKAGNRLTEVVRHANRSAIKSETITVQNTKLSRPKMYSILKRFEGFIQNSVIRLYSCRC